MHEGHERRGLLTRSSGTHRPCRDTSLCTRCLPANLQLALCRAHKISTKKKKKKKKKTWQVVENTIWRGGPGWSPDPALALRPVTRAWSPAGCGRVKAKQNGVLGRLGRSLQLLVGAGGCSRAWEKPEHPPPHRGGWGPASLTSKDPVSLSVYKVLGPGTGPSQTFS